MKVPAHELEVSYSRSSGPGGQNVNKVNSKCTLKWNFLSTHVLNTEAKQRFTSLYGNKISSDGWVVIVGDRFRDQKKNYNDCLTRLESMLVKAKLAPKKRIKTKPTKSSQSYRIEKKKIHSHKKSMRQKYREE